MADPAYATETAVLALANAGSGMVHYAGLRRWAFGR